MADELKIISSTVEKATDSFFVPLKNRLSNSWTASFAIAWLIINWQPVLYLVLAKEPILERFEYIEGAYYDNFGSNWWYYFILPLLIGAFYAFVFPFIEPGMEWATLFQKRLTILRNHDLIMEDLEKQKIRNLKKADVTELEELISSVDKLEKAAKKLNKDIEEEKENTESFRIKFNEESNKVTGLNDIINGKNIENERLTSDLKAQEAKNKIQKDDINNKELQIKSLTEENNKLKNSQQSIHDEHQRQLKEIMDKHTSAESSLAVTNHDNELLTIELNALKEKEAQQEIQLKELQDRASKAEANDQMFSHENLELRNEIQQLKDRNNLLENTIKEWESISNIDKEQIMLLDSDFRDLKNEIQNKDQENELEKKNLKFLTKELIERLLNESLLSDGKYMVETKELVSKLFKDDSLVVKEISDKLTSEFQKHSKKSITIEFTFDREKLMAGELNSIIQRHIKPPFETLTPGTENSLIIQKEVPYNFDIGFFRQKFNKYGPNINVEVREIL